METNRPTILACFSVPWPKFLIICRKALYLRSDDCKKKKKSLLLYQAPSRSKFSTYTVLPLDRTNNCKFYPQSTFIFQWKSECFKVPSCLLVRISIIMHPFLNSCYIISRLCKAPDGYCMVFHTNFQLEKPHGQSD